MSRVNCFFGARIVLECLPHVFHHPFRFEPDPSTIVCSVICGEQPTRLHGEGFNAYLGMTVWPPNGGLVWEIPLFQGNLGW